jgi:hypothetical protein
MTDQRVASMAALESQAAPYVGNYSVSAVSQYRQHRWTNFSVAGLMLSAASAVLPLQAAVTFEELDFSRALEDAQKTMVFVPIRNTTTNNGVFWYKDLQQKITGPSRLNNVQRKISLRAFPASHDNGRYSSFVSQYRLLDARVNLLPSNAIACEPSQVLKDKLAELQLNYQFTTTRGGYPGLCFLDIKYVANTVTPAETELVRFIQNNQVLNIRYQITLPATPAVTMDVPALVQRLRDAQLLTAPTLPTPELSNSTPEPVWQGELYPVVFASTKYPAALFRSDLAADTELAYSDWVKFLTLFHIGVDGRLSMPQADAQSPLELVAEIPGGVVVSVQQGDQN